MKIKLILIGKTDKTFVVEGLNLYLKRIKHYINLETIIIPDLKKTAKLSMDQQKEKEGALILSRLSNIDYVILLDERGKTFDSFQYARLIESHMIKSTKSLCFIVGGSFGFSEKVYERSDMKLSLSKMTFSHQLIRIIFLEQLYRAFTIIRGEPYHNA